MKKLIFTFLMLCLWATANSQVPELLYYKFNQPGTSIQNNAQPATAVGTNPAAITGTGLSIGGTGMTGTALVGTGVTSTGGVINTGWLTNLSGSFTIAWWTSNMTSSSTLWYIFGDAGASTLRCFTNGAAGAGNWLLRGGGLPDLTFTGAAVTGPKMMHAVYNATTSEYKAYIDGVLVQTLTSVTYTGMAGTGFQIGGYSTNSNLSGNMDEFRIYNRALSAAEIATTWNIEIGSVSAPNDAGVTQINSPVAPASPGIQNVSATIKNYGSNQITSVNVNWSVNGVLQTPVPYTSTLDTTGGTGANTALVALGSYTFPAGNNTIKAWTSLPNNQPDTVNLNDTSQVTIYFATTMSGIYTIGGTNPDFTSFNNALTALYSGGISGPVTFNVAPGTYTEQLTFNGDVLGSSTVNTITFQVATGDSTSVLLQYAAAAAADNWVVRFVGASNITFKQMTIEATGASNGRVFEIMTGSKRITITNCIVKSSITGTSSTFAGIYSASANTGVDYLTVTNNVFIGGYYSIYWYGSSANKKNHLLVENNIMTDFYYYGVQCYYVDSVFIRYNTITNRTTSATTYAVYVYYNTGASEIIGNKVHLQGTSTQYGIISGYKLVANTIPMLIGNNFVSQIGSTGTVYAIYLLSTNYVNVYHNSVRVGNGSATGGRALFASAGTNLNIINNSFANFGGGYAIYTSSATNIISSNYNNFYTNGVSLGYWGTAIQATFAAWQTASLMDGNSKNIDPQYTSFNDLHSTSVGMWQAGTPLAAVPLDIDMEPRDPIAPCIGADEYMLYANDAGVSEITEPISVCAGIANVKVKIKNFGIQSFTAVTVNWSVNGVFQTPFAYTSTSALMPGADQEVTLGTYTFVNGVPYDFVFYTSSPGSAADQNPVNDTLKIFGFQTAMSGTFTIGSGVTYDFNTISAAVAALNNFGVCGPITFNIAAGTYNDQINLTNLLGTSSTNTVTFKSANSDKTSVIVQYAAGAENYVVNLDNTSFVKFQHITFEATGTSYGHVFQIRNGSNNNEISNCKLVTSISTSSSFSGIYVGSTICNNNEVLNNEISGGYYGIYWYGSSSTARGQGLLVDNNTFTDFYYYGVNISYMDNVCLRGNYMKNAPNATSIYGARIYYCDNIIVAENDIQLAGTSTHYGMYLYYNTGTSTTPNLIANNVINMTGTGTSTWYGVYFYNQIYSNFYHNSIQLSAGSTSGYAFYQSSGNNQNVVNNILAHNGGGYAYYVATIAGIINSNNNNYFTTGSPLAYWGTACADLFALQTANMMDLNSGQYNPVYASIITGDLTPLSVNIDNMGTPVGVLIDIKGVTRSTMTPDIGAIEFTGLGADIALIGGSLAAGQCLSTNDSVYITIANVIGSTVNFSTATMTVYWSVTGPVNSNGTIVLNSGTLAPATSLMIGGAAVNMSLPGVYTLSAYIGANAANLFQGNDTLQNMASQQIYNPFYVEPKNVVITDPTMTVDISAKSKFFPGGSFFISEICHWRSSSTGAPVGGWPSYLNADDYIEITGVPNSDLAGYTLEQWDEISMVSTYTFPTGTVMGPNGTATFAVGQMGSDVPVPASFHYHANGGYTGSFGSTVVAGRILKDGSGNIVDAVGYGTYTFPAAANVTSADWSGNTPGLSSAGNKLAGAYTKDATNWVNSGVSPQDPNTLNAGVTLPVPGTLTSFTWSHNGVVFATNVIDTTVGPWASSGVHHYVASYVTPCGTLSDTVTVTVNIIDIVLSGDTTICEGDTAYVTIEIPGTAPYSVIFTDGTLTDTLSGIPFSPFVFPLSPAQTVTLTATAYADATNVFTPTNKSVTITVQPLPVVTITPFSPLCEYDTALTLTGGQPMGGVYSGTGVAAGVFDPAIAGVGAHTITYTYTDIIGCVGSNDEVIDVNPAPTVTITGAADTICETASVMLDAGSGFASYVWSDASTSQTLTVTGTSIGAGNSGTFTVTVTNSFGCEGSDQVTIHVIDCSGIEEVLSNGTIHIWPNPNTGTFNMKTTGIAGDATLHILKATGEMVKSENLTLGTEDTREFDLSNLAAGVYYIKLITKYGTITEKVMIR